MLQSRCFIVSLSNVCSDTLFGSLKVERLYGQRFKTKRRAKDETFDWLLWSTARVAAHRV